MSVKTLKANYDKIERQFRTLESEPDSPEKDVALDNLLIRRDIVIRQLCKAYNAENPDANWRPVTGIQIVDGEPRFDLARAIATSDEMYQVLARMHQGGQE